jgi:hypothetical protein
MFLYLISPSPFMENIFKIGFTNNIHKTYEKFLTMCGNPELHLLIKSKKADILKSYIHDISPIIQLNRGKRQFLNGVYNIDYITQYTYKNNPSKYVNSNDFYYVSNFDLIVDMCKTIDKDLEIVFIDDLEFNYDFNTSNKLQLYYYQQQFVNKFNDFIETKTPLNGILQMATGTGKTITLLTCLDQYWNKYNIHKPCLWISIQNNILDSQDFYNYDKYPFLKDKVIQLSNGGFNIDLEQFRDKQVLLILLRQTITTSDNVNKIPNDFLGGIFYDEIHDGINSSNSLTYQKLNTIKQKNKLHFFIGASATPLTLYHDQLDNMCHLFSCSKNELILYNYTYNQAVIDKILVPYCMNFMTTINKTFFNKFINKITELPTNKILLYFPTLEIRDNYIYIFNDMLKKHKLDCNIWKTDAKYTEYDKQFISDSDNVNKITLMFACDKFKVGTDIPDLSMIVDYTGTGIPSVVSMIQKCGRLTRKDKEKKKEQSDIKPCYWLIHENKENYRTIYYNYLKYLISDYDFEKSFKDMNDVDKDIENILNSVYDQILVDIEFEENQLSYKDILTDIIVKENEKRQYHPNDTIRIKSVRKICLLHQVKTYIDYKKLQLELKQKDIDIIPQNPESYFSDNKNYRGFYQLIYDDKDFDKLMKRKYNPTKFDELKQELLKNKVTKDKYELYRIQNDINNYPSIDEITNRYFVKMLSCDDIFYKNNSRVF